MAETASVAFDLSDAVVAELLEGANLARLAYVGRNGRPHVVPIWFAHIDGEIIMVTGPKADKVPALEANGAVALTIDSSTPPYHVLLVDGDATVERVDGIAPEYPAIAERYLGALAEPYMKSMRERVKTQRRIRVRVRTYRVLDFAKRFPKSHS
jgi:PPOX class probable F420-dependent enzyme